MRVYLVLLILFTMLVGNTNAQERVFKFFTTKDGLPSNTIFKIRFDNQGFLWIAHDKGISRFDGYTFKNYSNPKQKSNVYTDMHIGKDGKVWVSNLGLQIFYIENDEMKLYKSFDLKYTPSSLKMGFLSNGNIIVNARGGITEIDVGTGQEYLTFFGSALQTFYVSEDKVFFTNPLNFKLTQYQNRKLTLYNESLIQSPIYVNDSLIISSYNNISSLIVTSRISGTIKTYELNYNYNFSEYLNGQFLVYTNNGIHQIIPDHDSIRIQKIAEGYSYSHFAKDPLGNEWFSTLNEGILFLPSANCRKLSNTKDNEYLKLVQFQNKAYTITNKNKLFGIQNNILKEVGDFNGYLNDKSIILMKNLHDKKLVVGNSKFLYLDSGLTMHPYFPELSMKDICMDKGKYVYMATSGMVYRHQYSDQAFMRLTKERTFKDFGDIVQVYPIQGRFNCVAYDTVSSDLYFGGVPGFFQQKDNSLPVEILDHGNSIYTTIIDYRNPYIIVGTIQSGIYILKNGIIIKHLNSKNSTIGNTITKIKHYGDYTWVLSEKGLHNIDVKSMKVQSYTNVGAVSLTNCSDFTLSNGALYLISNSDLYSVDLYEFVKSITPVPVFFKSVITGAGKIIHLHDLRFSHNQNSFAIEMDIPATKVLGNAEFEYTLNNSQWFQMSKGQTEIFLNELSPDKYLLNVRQKGMNTLYSFSFVIEAPWWTTWWFISLLILTAASLTLIIYRGRISTISEKSRLEVEKIRLEKSLQQNILSSIKSQMNPHFLFNALNTIQSYIYLNDKKQAIGYLGKFSVLTRRILDQSNHETISLSEEHETLELYLQLEKMRFEDTFDYKIIYENIPFKDHFKVPPMLIQPYLENAVKHGLLHKPGNRILEVRFLYMASMGIIQVSIDDNGVGRKKSSEINLSRNKEHQSFSTEANKTRLEILNQQKNNPISIVITDKTDAYGNANGTLVQINIPVS